jgi:hypothetical protein
MGEGHADRQKIYVELWDTMGEEREGRDRGERKVQPIASLRAEQAKVKNAGV